MNIDPDIVKAVLTFIVGGGLVTFITQVVRGWSSLRSGARANTREVIKDLAAARDESEDREADVRQDKDYWRNTAGGYAYQLRSAGLIPEPQNPRSPSEVRRDKLRDVELRTRRQRRAALAPDTAEIERIMDEGP